jgi:hypothetical protein
MTLAVPNANASSLAVPRYPGTADDHNAAVKAYFVGAGLPEAQILAVTPQAGMVAAGSMTTRTGTPTLAYYFSTVHRQAAGVEVVDSFAWARLNANGDVVHESVYWPELPASVLSDATVLANMIGDSTSRAAFTASLPKDLLTTNGSVVVRHTSGEWAGSFAAAACYDVVDDGGRIRHFDRNAVEFQLPHELPGAWGPANETPRGATP